MLRNDTSVRNTPSVHPSQTQGAQPAAPKAEPRTQATSRTEERAEVDPARQADTRSVRGHGDVEAARRVNSTAASSSCGSQYLNPGHIERVVDMKDPVERNHRITQGYHELSEGMANLVGRDNANWLTYGKWASNTAGAAIRKEIDMKAPGEGIPLLGGAIGGGRHVLDGHFKDKAADAVAKGNQEIFKDIGPHFARFINTFENDQSWKGNPRRGQRMMDRFLSDPRLLGHDKQDLRNAFKGYYEAMQLKDSTNPADVEKRAQIMLRSNVLVAQHEQRVADQYVRDAMPGKTLNDNVTGQMRMNLPSASLVLGKDIPRPGYLHGAQFPDSLRELHPDVDALRTRYSQHNGDTKESAVGDWSHYDDRMGFIFQYFRAYQQDASLHARP